LGADNLASNGRGRAVSKYWVRSSTKLKPIGKGLHYQGVTLIMQVTIYFYVIKTSGEVVWNLGC